MEDYAAAIIERARQTDAREREKRLAEDEARNAALRAAWDYVWGLDLRGAPRGAS